MNNGLTYSKVALQEFKQLNEYEVMRQSNVTLIAICKSLTKYKVISNQSNIPLMAMPYNK